MDGVFLLDELALQLSSGIRLRLYCLRRGGSGGLPSAVQLLGCLCGDK